MLPNAHLTPGGVLFGILVGWWLTASAIARSFEAARAIRALLRGQ